MSFIKTINKGGLSTVLWGTPDVAEIPFNLKPWYWTVGFLPATYGHRKKVNESVIALIDGD